MKARFLALAALLFGLAACQTEPEGFDVNLGGEQTATISVVLPEDAITRAGGTDSAASGLDNTDKIVRVVMHIYDEAGRVSNNRYVDYLEGDARTVNFDIRLVPDRKYTFVAWADQVDAKVDEDKYFNTKSKDGLANVTPISGTWTAMNEERDAFTATHTEAKYTSSSNITLKLIRPFAKLRVVATDMEFLNDLDVQPTTATVSYATKHYNAFNAVTGVAINKENIGVEHEYTIASYGEKWAEGADMTLFTDYFFAADEQEVVNFSLEVFDQNNKSIKYNNFNTAIPVKRNNLTTIKGNVLTEGNDIKVTIDERFENGSEWNPEKDEYDVEVWDGKTIAQPAVNDEGSYLICTPAELAWLAAAVNGTLEETRGTVAAQNFAGNTFLLMSSIDLNNEAWTPIGNSTNKFKGNFDGQNNTIYNLVVRGGSEDYKGLFGFTTDGEIKNLVVENAKVSGRVGVGVVAGTPYTTKYSNITVQGHVEVDGMSYVGGVGGYNVYADWTDITVDVDETSYVNANSVENGKAYRTYVGGVTGFHGEGNHKFTNISSNINVKGSTIDVGGLFGIAHYGNQFESCSCSGNVTITIDDAECALEMGGIAGVWHNGGEDVVFTNCSFAGELLTPNITEEIDFYYGGLVGKPYSATGTGKLILNGYEMVANGVGVKDGEYYVFSADGLRWIAATVNAGDTFDKKSIKLVNDIDLSGAQWTPIGTGKNHFRGSFDGQDKTISGMTITEYQGQPQAALFGTVSYTPSFKNLTIYGATVVMPEDHDGDFYAAGLIGTYYGNVTVENVTVKNSTFAGNNKVAGLLAHDGVCSNLKISNTHVLNCTISSTHLTDGGNVGGMLGLFQGAANGEFKITGSSVKECTITGINSSNNGKRANAQFVACVNSKANQTLVIENCVVENNTFTQTINGTDAVTYVSKYDNVFVGGDRENTYAGTVIINGVKYAGGAKCENGTWNIDNAAGLQAAMNAVSEGETIVLAEDIIVDKPVVLAEGKTAVLDLNGKTLAADDVQSTYAINNLGTLTIKGRGTVNARGIYNGYGNGGNNVPTAKLIIENGTFKAKGTNGGACVYNYGTVDINGGTFESVGGYGLNNQSGAVMTVDNALVRGGIYNSSGRLTVNANVYQHISGRHAIYNWAGSVEVNGGEFDSESGNELILADGQDATVVINDGTFNKTAKSWLFGAATGKNISFEIKGGTHNGYVNMPEGTVDTIRPYGDPIAVKGGTFNFNPTTWVADGYKAVEANGVWTVVLDPAVKIGDAEYATFEEAVAAAKAGDTIILNKDVTLSAELIIPAGVTLNGNGKQINGTLVAGGDLTFAGHTKVTAFSASYYNRTITIGEGACLEVTGTGRVSLAYGNTFDIKGNIENAKSADKANIQPSLIIPGGISITGGNDATMNFTNAYVQIGSTSSKNNSANGTFNLNFENSIAEFTDQFTFAEPTSGKNPTFNVNIKNSVLTTATKMCIAAPNSNVVIDNSTVTLGRYLRNSGTLTLKNGSVLTGATTQFGENGGNDGAINVDNSSLTVTASSAGHAFDGKDIGSITATNGATVSVDYYKDMTISVDATSTFTGTEVN